MKTKPIIIRTINGIAFAAALLTLCAQAAPPANTRATPCPRGTPARPNMEAIVDFSEGDV